MLKIERVLLLLAVSVALSACSVGESHETTSATPLKLEIGTVEEANVPVNNTVPGSIVSDNRIDVSSRTVGFIEQLDVREGQHVSRGDVLVRIDSSDVDEAIRQAKAGLAAARETLADAQVDAKKYINLSATGTVSSETLRKAKVNVDIAKANLDKAKSAVAAAEAQKEYTTITSPVDGVVVSVAMRRGEMAVAGATLLTVESSKVLVFKAYVTESDLATIDTKEPVAVRIDSLGDRKFEGHLRGIVPSADNVTRRYEINVVMPMDSALLPGMFGRAEFVLGHEKQPVVPKSALVDRGGLEGVFVIADARAEFRWLRLGKQWNDLWVVTAGLSGGEKIALNADDSIRDGASVAIDGNTQ